MPLNSVVHPDLITCMSFLLQHSYVSLDIWGTRDILIFRVTTCARLLCDYRSHTTCSYIYTQTWHRLLTNCMRKYVSIKKQTHGREINMVKIYFGSWGICLNKLMLVIMSDMSCSCTIKVKNSSLLFFWNMQHVTYNCPDVRQEYLNKGFAILSILKKQLHVRTVN